MHELVPPDGRSFSTLHQVQRRSGRDSIDRSGWLLMVAFSSSTTNLVNRGDEYPGAGHVWRKYFLVTARVLKIMV